MPINNCAGRTNYNSKAQENSRKILTRKYKTEAGVKKCLQCQFSCALKLARQCEIEHWFLCGADGISIVMNKHLNILIDCTHLIRHIENTSWKVLAYGIYARVVDVSEIERVSAATE